MYANIAQQKYSKNKYYILTFRYYIVLHPIRVLHLPLPLAYMRGKVDPHKHDSESENTAHSPSQLNA